MAYTNTYQRINWQNLPSEATALNDVNLNKMDAEIYAHGEQFETVDTALGHKVDKESGKGLSAIKTLSISTSANTGTDIASISYKDQNNLTVGYTIKNGVVVDSALSSSSENPVQNKVVKSAVDAKSTVSISDTLVTGDTIANLTINGTTTAIKAPLVEVDDTPSATSENPLQNKAIYEMLNNLLPEETVQGNPIAISDASGLNAKSCSVDLLPIQDLSHGEPSPTNICPISGRNSVKVKRTGKNLFQTTATSQTINGTVFTVNADGSVTIKNTPFSAISSYNFGVITLQAGTYKANGFIGGASNNIRLNFKDNDSSTVYAIIYDNRDIEFTLTEETDVRVYPIVPTTWDGNEVTMYPMIRLATVDDGTFEPYQGETYTENLGQTVYGGNVDFVNGKVTIDREFIEVTEVRSVNISNNIYYWQIVSGIDSFNSLRENELISNIFVGGSFALGKTYITANGKLLVAVPYDQTLNTKALADAWCATNKPQFCYKIATPIILTLTAEQISLLKGNNVVSTNGDNINLVYSADIGLYIANQLQS